MELFKGYIKTNGKTAIQKFKNTTLLTFDEVKDLESYAGILADDVVLIDIDDMIQADKLMRIVEDNDLLCRVSRTTHGMHFFFKNSEIEKCGTKVKLAIGLIVDIKYGKHNSYSILKKQGIERKIIYDILDDEEYQTLPKFLLPVKSSVDFTKLEQGDGRNQNLFNYILTLQSAGFTKDECRKTLQIINDYVLPQKLSQSELDTLSRDEAFQKDVFFSGKTFLFDKFASFLKSEYNIIRVHKQLHIYDDGVYKFGNERIECKMIKHIPTLTKAKRQEVLAYLDILCQDEKEISDAKYIAFRNGIFNIETNELLQFTPDIVILNKINYNYNSDATCEDIDKMLTNLAVGDKTIFNLLCEAVGYCFYRRNELRKAFILTGEKQNGKSTFLSLVRNLLGSENISSLDLSELGMRFKSAELYGKLANVGDDIGDDFIANPAIFKKVVSGDTINAERKGKDPFDFNNYSKFLFSANSIPRIKDKTGAVISRLIIIPFNAHFDESDADYDPYIKYKIMTENAMEYLILLGITGLQRVLNNYSFSTSEKTQKELTEFEESNNPILLFFKDIDKDEIIGRPVKDVYLRYSAYCAEGNFSPMSGIEFSKQIKKAYNITSVVKRKDGKLYRIYGEDE